MPLKKLIQLRRDTAANWASVNPTLGSGEPGYETDTKKIKYGDGLLTWNLLPYFVSGTPTDLSNYETSSQLDARDAANRDRDNHIGTQTADTITDGTTNKAYTATEKSKLAGVATGATANSSDATLKARANHTGTQTASTISDFQTTVSANTDVASNTYHRGRSDNPHVVTKAQVGLSNVPNTDFTSAVAANTAKVSFDSTSSTKLAGIEANANKTPKVGATAPVTPNNGDLWYDTSDDTTTDQINQTAGYEVAGAHPQTQISNTLPLIYQTTGNTPIHIGIAELTTPSFIMPNLAQVTAYLGGGILSSAFAYTWGLEYSKDNGTTWNTLSLCPRSAGTNIFYESNPLISFLPSGSIQPARVISKGQTGVRVRVFIQVSSVRTKTDGVTTSGSKAFTSATANFTSADIGRVVSSNNVVGGTTIASITSTTSVQLSANATASGTAQTFTVSDSVAVICGEDFYGSQNNYFPFISVMRLS